MNYYNEIDPYAAEWLRNLIAAGHIAPGDVDQRSIEDVRPNELQGYTQCHFFAGIGVWSAALRGAGWPDDRPVWTGSCPCQPFSAAGQGEGFADERHLWPHFFHLIQHGKSPGVPVLGEQVASKDGLAWLDLVQADMEAAGHAFGAVDLCAAGVGAPHIRQRLYWVADTMHTERRSFNEHREDGCDRTYGGREKTHSITGACGEVRGMADTTRRRKTADEQPRQICGPKLGGFEIAERQPTARPTNGFWGGPDWLFCRDGKWRPVEPGTFPLAHGATARVGRLRAYGNAINKEVAEEFIRAIMHNDPR